jgi:hypothetical protein
MASIPLPALAVKPAEQPDVLGQLSRLQALRSMQNQQQIQQQQIEAGQQENAAREQQLKDSQIISRAFVENNGDPDKVLKQAAQNGASAAALQQWQQHAMDIKGKAIDLVTKQGAAALQQADLAQGAHDTVMKADPAQRPQVYQQQLQALQNAGVDTSQLPPQYPGDEQFKVLGAVVSSHKQQVDDAAKQVGISKDVAQTAEATAKAAQAAANTTKTKKETEQLGQVTPKDKYVQQQENYRATLARQTTTANQRQNQGITALQKQSDDYSKVLSSASTLKNSLQAAQDGNEMAAAVAPLQGTLFITTTEGVKRINQTELAGVEGAGSLIQRINGALSSKQTGGGPLSQSLKDDMAKLVDIYTKTKFQNYQNQANYTKKLHGLGDETPLLDQNGNISGAPGSQSSDPFAAFGGKSR